MRFLPAILLMLIITLCLTDAFMGRRRRRHQDGHARRASDDNRDKRSAVEESNEIDTAVRVKRSDISNVNNRVRRDAPTPCTTSPPPKECGQVYMTYTLDDSGEVFADGVQIVSPIDDKWPAIGVVSIPCGTRVLAFRTLNSPRRPGSPCGVRALIGNGIKTDSRSPWKCSDKYVIGWNMAGFDDSSWNETQVQSTYPSPAICGDCYTIGFGPRGSTGPGPYYIRLTLA